MRLCLVLVFCLVFVVAVVVLADPSHGESRSSQSQVSSEESKKVRRPRDKEASGKSNKEEVGKKRKSKETNADAKDKKSPKSTKKVNPQKVKKIKKTKSVLYGKGKKSGRQPGKGKKPGRQPGKNKLRKKHRKTKTMEGGSIDTLQTECPGECIKSGEECQSGVVLQEGCQKGFQCCDAGDLEEKAGVKRYCNPLDACSKLKGECQKQKTGCQAGEVPYFSNSAQQYCTKDCICCVKEGRCRTKQKCSNKKGACQNARQQCNGRLVKNNKKFCRGRKCACCIPPKPCKLKRKCFNAGGVCQAKTAACEGETITTRGFCRSKCLCCLPKAEDKFEWGYLDKNGPNVWPTVFPQCGGAKQSPVALDANSAGGNYLWPPLGFKHYDEVPTTMNLTNNGHTGLMMVELSDKATVQGGDLNGKYAFIQGHFHWGADDSRGSEHTIDGRSFPGELHLVHYKTDYGSIENAVTYEDGLAVLGVMLVISPNDNPKLQKVIDGLARVHEDGQVTAISPFPLEDLLPNDVHEFFRYQGSLTTPTCSEIVVWTVFKDPIYISSTQLAEFRKLLEKDGLPLVDNFRPVQPLNNRTVSMGASKPYWGYVGKFGPDQWVNSFPLCGGSGQSPVDLALTRANAQITPAFKFTYYDVSPSRATIVNNGHTAQVMLETSYTPTMSGGGLDGEYAFLQLHFHWGSDSSMGSEHTFDGISFPGELHLVHYKTDYGSVENAVTYEDGLAVLGVMLVISPNDNPKLQKVIDGLANIHKAKTEASIATFPLEDLLPDITKAFFRYQGSLTTPTCSEIVVWTVFKLPISISLAQIAEFRKLEDKAGKLLLHNNRPVQSLNGRTVYITGALNV